MKHTPSPWAVNFAGGAKSGQPFKITEIYVYAPATQDDTAICADIIDPVTQEPSEANAHLIAAAPELLEACVMMLCCMRLAGWEGDHATLKAIAAITKATGEQA